MVTPDITTHTYNKKVLITVILLTSFFNSLMGAAVNIALPRIGNEYGMNAISISWVAMSFLLASAMFSVPFGRIADVYGRKKIFQIGNIIFTIASLLCMIPSNGLTFIICRFLQGTGSAMIISTSMALLTSAYPPNERGRVIGMNISSVYLGLTLAPALGGILTQTLGWRSIFLFNAIAGFLVMFAIIFKIRTEWAEENAKEDKIDYKGSFIYLIAIFLLMYGFSKLPDHLAIILTVTGIILMVVFYKMEVKTQHPILNMQLFRQSRIFTLSNLAALINYAATFGITFLLSLYLQYVKGLSPRDAGLILITQPAFMALTATFTGKLSDKHEPQLLSSVGMTIIVIGLILLIFLGANTTYPYIISSLIIVGIGFGFFSSPNTNAIMGSVEKRYLGTASAMTGTMRLIGQMTSMAIAAMIIHIFLGTSKITSSNIPFFIQSTRISFMVFAALCLFGIIASLARGKKLAT